MSLDSTDRMRLQQILDELRTGRPSSEDSAWLRDQVLNNLEARQLYIESLWLSGCLAWLLKSIAEPEEVDIALPAEIAAPLVARPPAVTPLPVVRRMGRYLTGSSMLATLLIAVVVYSGFGLLVWEMGHLPDLTQYQGVQAPVEPSPEIVVARVMSLRSGAQPLVNGKSIRAGEDLCQEDLLELDSGIMEITYSDGAHVVFEGPVRVHLASRSSARLEHGKLLATIPRSAIGFTVETPLSRIVDLGTEFGVEVASSGAALVQVLTGRVHVETNLDEMPPRTIPLATGQALRIDASGKPQTPHWVTDDSFQRLASPASASSSTDPYEVVFHYRLGEDDAHAEAGGAVARESLGSGTEGCHFPLQRFGGPRYSVDMGDASGTMALRTTGNVAEGFVARGLKNLPVDNFVLEVWLRPHSLHEGEPVYVGHSKFDGYGILIREGNWAGLCGSLGFADAGFPAEVNQWTHVAWVHENGRAQFFVNGKASGPEHRLEPKTPEPVLRVGYRDERLPISFDGDIDMVRLIRMKRIFHPDMLMYPARKSPR